MALSKGPGDDGDDPNLGIWNADTTLRKDEYFTRYLDGNPSPDDAAFEPELGKLLAKLYDRQRQEAYGLLDKAIGRLSPDGEDRETLKIHKEEFREDYQKRCRAFGEERDRHISDYKNEQVIREQMQNDERQEALKQGLDDNQKFTY